MKRIIIVLIAIFPMFSYAQTTFYVEPVMRLTKLDITSTSSMPKSTAMPMLGGSTSATPSFRLLGPALGLNIGLSFKGQRQHLYFGVDRNKTARSYAYSNYPQVVSVETTEDGRGEIFRPKSGGDGGSLEDEMRFYTLHLTFDQRLSSDANLHKWYALAGLDFTLQPSEPRSSHGSVGELSNSDTTGYMIMNDMYRASKSDGLGLPFALSLDLGLKVDFYTRKGKYVLSSALFYRHGFEVIATTEITLITADGNNRTITPSTVYSKGSGLFLNVSRRLNLHFDKEKRGKI